VARLDDLGAEERKERADEVRRKLKEAHEILSTPAGTAEPRAAAILKVCHDLQEVEQWLPGSRAVQGLLRRAHQEAAVLRDRLWQDGQQLMGGRAVGQTLGRRCKRAEEGVRLLAMAKELDQDGLPALADDLSKARYRLSYLQTAQRKAKAARRRRLPIYAFLGVVAAGALLLLCMAFGLVPFPAWRAGIAPAVTPTPAHTAVAPVGQTAAPTAADTTTPATTQPAWSPTAAPAGIASPTPPPLTRSPTATPGDTASPTLVPVTRSPTATPGETVIAMPSPTLRPTTTPAPAVTATPLPTKTPTARPRQATAALPPTAGASPAPNLAPGPVYPAPELLQPEDVVYFSRGAGSQYSMRWQWDGTLRADEWFDVRVWQEGMPHYGIAWTRQPGYTYDLCTKGSGYFLWSVAVVRGQDGRWLADLSPEATPRHFSNSRDDRWCARNGRLLPGIVP
jgi:hypothetical protein